jgi:sugar phosphate isomerase/epimerase
MDFERALHSIREQFDCVEIHSLWNKTVEDLSDDEAAEAEALIRKYRIKVSCLSTTLFLMCPLYGEVEHLEKFSDDFLVFIGDLGEHTDRLKRCMELAAQFDTEYIRIFPFRLEGKIGKSYETVVSDMGEALSEAVVSAERGGKCLLLENCPHSYFPRGGMCFELVERIDSSKLMLLYDIGNSFTSDRRQIPDRFRQVSLEQEYEKIKSRVRHFHFKDYRKGADGFHHVAFGTGDIDYENLVAHIKRDGRSVTVSLEPEVEAADLDKSIFNFLAITGP